MKSIVSFILGFIAGVASILIFGLSLNGTGLEQGKTMFEAPGECISTSKMQVIQVIDENSAIAYEVEYNDVLKKDFIKSDGIIVLVTNDNDNVYYDEQIVNLPSGKCFRQVGVYKYTAKSDMNKTIPIVKIME
jgi:hypothetical protein